VPDQPPEAVLEELREQVAGLRTANARLREVVEAKDAQLAVAQAALEAAEARFDALSERVAELERRLGKDSLLTEQGPVFPQLEGLAVALGCTVTARG
jgi:chromosome segregation ATPase